MTRAAISCRLGRDAPLPLGEVYRCIDGFAAQGGLDDDVVGELKLICDELLSNGARHSRAAGDAGLHVHLEFSREERRVRLRYADDGEPFDPLAADVPELGWPVGRRAVGGLGLYLLRELTAAQRYHREAGENVLDLELDLERSNKDNEGAEP